jgi:uncharacterized protein with GYD domain
MVESLGGKLETFYFAFGDMDVYTIVDVPDNIAGAAIKPPSRSPSIRAAS